MERPRYVFIGGFVSVAATAFVAVFGLSALPDGRAILWAGLLVLGGVAFVVGGWVDAVTVGGRDLAWWRFVGLGNVLVGLALVVAYAPDLLAGASSSRFLLSAVAVLGGAIVLAIGLDTVRGGRYVTLRGM